MPCVNEFNTVAADALRNCKWLKFLLDDYDIKVIEIFLR